MYIKVLAGKIHRARITDKHISYMGSITIDPDLYEAAGLHPWQEVLVVNENNGARLYTYIIPGKRGSGEIILNGPSARLGEVGDIVVIMAFAYITPGEDVPPPKAVFVDENNKLKEVMEYKMPEE